MLNDPALQALRDRFQGATSATPITDNTKVLLTAQNVDSVAQTSLRTQLNVQPKVTQGQLMLAQVNTQGVVGRSTLAPTQVVTKDYMLYQVQNPLQELQAVVSGHTTTIDALTSSYNNITTGGVSNLVTKPFLSGQLASTVSTLSTDSAGKLVEAKAYTDTKIGQVYQAINALPSGGGSNTQAITQLSTQVGQLQTTMVTKAQQQDLITLNNRVNALQQQSLPTIGFGTGADSDRLTINGVASGPHLKGPAGATPTIDIGTVSTGPQGSQQVVTKTSSQDGILLNFVIPQGATGATGAAGTGGGTGEIIIGSTTTGLPGTSASVTKDGSGQLHFTIPRGQNGNMGAVGAPGPQGPQGQIVAVSQVQGNSLGVTNVGSSTEANLRFTFPQTTTTTTTPPAKPPVLGTGPEPTIPEPAQPPMYPNGAYASIPVILTQPMYPASKSSQDLLTMLFDLLTIMDMPNGPFCSYMTTYLNETYDLSGLTTTEQVNAWKAQHVSVARLFVFITTQLDNVNAWQVANISDMTARATFLGDAATLRTTIQSNISAQTSSVSGCTLANKSQVASQLVSTLQVYTTSAPRTTISQLAERLQGYVATDGNNRIYSQFYAQLTALLDKMQALATTDFTLDHFDPANQAQDLAQAEAQFNYFIAQPYYTTLRNASVLLSGATSGTVISDAWDLTAVRGALFNLGVALNNVTISGTSKDLDLNNIVLELSGARTGLSSLADYLAALTERNSLLPDRVTAHILAIDGILEIMSTVSAVEQVHTLVELMYTSLPATGTSLTDYVDSLNAYNEIDTATNATFGAPAFERDLMANPATYNARLLAMGLYLYQALRFIRCFSTQANNQTAANIKATAAYEKVRKALNTTKFPVMFTHRDLNDQWTKVCTSEYTCGGDPDTTENYDWAGNSTKTKDIKVFNKDGAEVGPGTNGSTPAGTHSTSGNDCSTLWIVNPDPVQEAARQWYTFTQVLTVDSYITPVCVPCNGGSAGYVRAGIEWVLDNANNPKVTDSAQTYTDNGVTKPCSTVTCTAQMTKDWSYKPGEDQPKEPDPYRGGIHHTKYGTITYTITGGRYASYGEAKAQADDACANQPGNGYASQLLTLSHPVWLVTTVCNSGILLGYSPSFFCQVLPTLPTNSSTNVPKTFDLSIRTDSVEYTYSWQQYRYYGWADTPCHAKNDPTLVPYQQKSTSNLHTKSTTSQLALTWALNKISAIGTNIHAGEETYNLEMMRFDGLFNKGPWFESDPEIVDNVNGLQTWALADWRDWKSIDEVHDNRSFRRAIGAGIATAYEDMNNYWQWTRCTVAITPP